MTDLEALRAELDAVDRALVECVGRRQALVRAIGEAKARSGRATRDFAREREVIEAVRAAAAEAGVRPDLVERLMGLLIEGSLRVQEQDRVAASARGTGRRALVIGGGGKMGGWFARFLATQGWQVTISDVAPPATPWQRIDWTTDPLDHELIVVATPLGHTNAVLHALAERAPTGVVFDIASLKTPLRTGLAALRDAGVRACSVHPMFGPDAALLSGRHVIFVDLGDPSAVAQARALFADTMAVSVQMTLDEHDRAIAYVLGLSHAVNIAFSAALADSGEQAEQLATLSSTTFDAQLEVARRVSAESPALYFEIQALNAYGPDALDALARALDQVRGAVRNADPEAFRHLMEAGRQWFGAR